MKSENGAGKKGKDFQRGENEVPGLLYANNLVLHGASEKNRKRQ